MALLVILYLSGTVATRAALPQAGIIGALVLGLPLGLSGYVLVASALIVLGAGLAVWPSAFVVAVVALAAAARGRHVLTPGLVRASAALATAAVALVVASLAAQAANLTRITPDSLQYVLVGSILDRTGEIGSAVAPGILEKRSILVVLLHAGADGLYRPSLAPLVGVAGSAAFVWLGLTVLRNLAVLPRTATLVLAAGLSAVVGSGRFAFNLFYVQGHLVFAVLVMLVVVMPWLAAVRGERAWAMLASVPLAAGALARPEAPLLLAVALVPALTDVEGLDRGARRTLAAAFAVTVLVWYGFGLRPALGGWTEGAVLGPIVAAAAVVAMTSIAELRLGPVQLLRRHAPVLAVVAVALVTAALGATDPEVLRSSLRATWENQVGGAGFWGVTWLVLGPLLLLAVIWAPLPRKPYWFTGVAAVPPLYLALAFLRDDPYRVGTSDSANRMLMHILFVAALAVAVSAGTLLTRTVRTAQEGLTRADVV